MQRVTLARAFVALTVSLTGLLLPAAGRAAADKKEVRFYTTDKVELHGTFYPSDAGNDPPCVLLVHKIGSDRTKGGWDELAKALQKDYAVLSFDLRGHGESVNVDPATFWTLSANRSMIRGASGTKDQIHYKEFSTSYYPMLANDIVAAKNFLDEQNNAHTCNSSNVVVIGAEDGAALAALWIEAGWTRSKQIKNAFGRVVPGGPPESEDVACAVWLSIPATFAGQSVEKFLVAPSVGKMVPMGFIYAKGDTRGAAAAKMMFDYMKSLKPKNSLNDKLEKDGKGAGADLLGKASLDTESQIVKYVAAVLAKRGANPWAERADPDRVPLYPLNLSTWYSFPR